MAEDEKKVVKPEDHKTAELNDDELDEVAGGWFWLDSVIKQNSQASPDSR